MTEAEVLEHVKQSLSRVFVIERMLLFGSRGRGTASAESDFDVLIVTDSQVPFIERQGLALLALGKRDYSIDLLVYTPEEFERERAILGSAVFWAEREGKVLVA